MALPWELNQALMKAHQGSYGLGRGCKKTDPEEIGSVKTR